jgi:hypothetical protein
MYLTAKLNPLCFQNIALGDLHELVFQLFIEKPTSYTRPGDGRPIPLAGMSVGSVSMLVSGAGAFMMVFSNSSLFYIFPPPSFIFPSL